MRQVNSIEWVAEQPTCSLESLHGIRLGDGDLWTRMAVESISDKRKRQHSQSAADAFADAAFIADELKRRGVRIVH